MGIPKFYTREEVAEMLKVNVRTVDRWRNEGKVKGKKIGGVVRFSEQQIKKLLKESN